MIESEFLALIQNFIIKTDKDTSDQKRDILT